MVVLFCQLCLLSISSFVSVTTASAIFRVNSSTPVAITKSQVSDVDPISPSQSVIEQLIEIEKNNWEFYVSNDNWAWGQTVSNYGIKLEMKSDTSKHQLFRAMNVNSVDHTAVFYFEDQTINCRKRYFCLRNENNIYPSYATVLTDLCVFTANETLPYSVDPKYEGKVNLFAKNGKSVNKINSGYNYVRITKTVPSQGSDAWNITIVDEATTCSLHPTSDPTINPSNDPTGLTGDPSNFPSTMPTTHPSNEPTENSSQHPSIMPTMQPSNDPTMDPTQNTPQPSIMPSVSPTPKLTHPILKISDLPTTPSKIGNNGDSGQSHESSQPTPSPIVSSAGIQSDEEQIDIVVIMVAAFGSVVVCLLLIIAGLLFQRRSANKRFTDDQRRITPDITGQHQHHIIKVESPPPAAPGIEGIGDKITTLSPSIDVDSIEISDAHSDVPPIIGNDRKDLEGVDVDDEGANTMNPNAAYLSNNNDDDLLVEEINNVSKVTMGASIDEFEIVGDDELSDHAHGFTSGK